MKRLRERGALVVFAALGIAGCSTPANDRTAAISASPQMRTMNTSLSDSQRIALDRELEAIRTTPGRSLTSIAALAIREGRIVYANAVGDAFIDPRDQARNKSATTDSMYRIASISKLVTSLAVVKLVDEGKLELDRDIGDYFGYSVRNPHFPDAKITLRLLMAHTSSLRDGGGYNFPETVNLRDVLLPGGSRYGSGAMWAKDRAPGGYFHYCNFNWGLIAQAMERATGERFDRLMQRVLFAPMRITATFDPASLSLADRSRVATLYRKRTEVNGKEIWNGAGPWVPQVDDFSSGDAKPRGSDAYVVGTNGTLYGPQGGLRISVTDLGKLMLMLMNGGQFEEKTILSKAAIAALFAEQWRFDRSAFGGRGNRAVDDEGAGGLFNAWALGPQIFLDISGQSRGDRIVEGGGVTGVGHLGNAYGLTSAFILDPPTKSGLIFFVGGIESDPERDKGVYSAFYRYEERILTALYRLAIQTH